jgi:hypothetical protein
MKRVNMPKPISFLKLDIMDGASKIKPTTIFTAVEMFLMVQNNEQIFNNMRYPSSK